MSARTVVSAEFNVQSRADGQWTNTECNIMIDHEGSHRSAGMEAFFLATLDILAAMQVSPGEFAHRLQATHGTMTGQS